MNSTRVQTGPEMRARLARLGVTLAAFSKYSGIDRRFLTRISSGQAPISSRVQEAVTSVEVEAENLAKRFAYPNPTIAIPHLDAPQEEGELPPSFYAAVAGAIAGERPATIVWETDTE